MLLRPPISCCVSAFLDPSSSSPAFSAPIPSGTRLRTWPTAVLPRSFLPQLRSKVQTATDLSSTLLHPISDVLPNSVDLVLSSTRSS